MATAYNYTTAGTGTFDSLGTVLGGQNETVQALVAANTRGTTLASDATTGNMKYLRSAFAGYDLLEVQSREVLQLYSEAAKTLLIETVDAEDPVPGRTLDNAIERLIAFMAEDSKTIEESAVGSSVANAGTGTGTLIVGLNHPDMDRELQMIRAEDIVMTCERDAQGGGAVIAGEEVFRIEGEAALDNFDRDWPGGSGMTGSIVCTHGGEDQRTGPNRNMLINSDLEDWTGNVPDSWTLKTGTAGVDLLEEATTFMRGTKAGEIVGDGSTLPHLRLPLDGVKGMKLKPQTPYALSIWMRRDGSSAAAGAAVLALTENDSTTEITDENSADIKVSIDLTALTTSFVNYGGIFWTPKVLPATPDIALILTTALTTGRSVFFDEIVLAEAVVPHAAGPQLALVAGGTDYVYGDTATATLTNDWADDEWIRELDRSMDWYGLSQQRRHRGLPLARSILLPPTSGSPNIADSLINPSF